MSQSQTLPTQTAKTLAQQQQQVKQSFSRNISIHLNGISNKTINLQTDGERIRINFNNLWKNLRNLGKDESSLTKEKRDELRIGVIQYILKSIVKNIKRGKTNSMAKLAQYAFPKQVLEKIPNLMVKENQSRIAKWYRILKLWANAMFLNRLVSVPKKNQQALLKSVSEWAQKNNHIIDNDVQIRMFTSTIVNNNTIHYKSNKTYYDAMFAMISDTEWRNTFCNILKSCKFTNFYFETPKISLETARKTPFEFVLINAPSQNGEDVDEKSFRQYFSTTKLYSVFKNVSKDATLIIPTPQSNTALKTYRNIAYFMRSAKGSQISEIWIQTAQTLLDCLANQPKKNYWLSTSGDGVSWLHIRIDESPKYYHFAKFK